jgi:hypothetical protein
LHLPLEIDNAIAGKKKHRDGGATSVDGSSTEPQQHRTNNSSDDIRDAINLHFLLCLPILD